MRAKGTTFVVVVTFSSGAHWATATNGFVDPSYRRLPRP